MPYLPPADPNYQELDCILVFYPNKPEYRQALLGSIADLSNVWNWEADRPTQAIIRQAWLDAEECTLECVEMSCLDAIADAIQNLADVLAAHDGCCDEVTTVPPGADEVSGTDDSTGAPEYDREADEHPTEFPDPAAYDAYLCGAAHNFADSTDGAVDAVYDTILVASNIIVFATLIVLAFGNVIGMAIAAVLAGGYTLVTISEVFGFFSAFTELRELLGGGDPGGLVPQTKSELDAIHDDLVDAIFCSNDASEATSEIHALVDANVTSSSYRAIIKLMWNELVIRAIYAGFVNVADRFDCTCGLDFTFIHDWDFDDGLGPWAAYGGSGAVDSVNCAPDVSRALTTGGLHSTLQGVIDNTPGQTYDPNTDYYFMRVEVGICFETSSTYVTEFQIPYETQPSAELVIDGVGDFSFDPAVQDNDPVAHGTQSIGFAYQSGTGSMRVAWLRIYVKAVSP